MLVRKPGDTQLDRLAIQLLLLLLLLLFLCLQLLR
jgi:hypothetical protein